MNSSKADTRYNPAPAVRRVPLCPPFDTVIPSAAWEVPLQEPAANSSTPLWPDSAAVLSRQLAVTFGRPGTRVYLVDSGTTALWLAFDAFANMGLRTIAVPAFGCPAFVRAARLVGMRVRLCDCERGRLVPGPQEFMRAIDEGIDVAVVADTLGQTPNEAVFDVLDQYGVPIVRDIAQSYAPSAATVRGDVAVFSFGRHKPLPIGSGGALMVLEPHGIETRITSRFSQLCRTATAPARPWFTDAAAATKWVSSQPITAAAMDDECAQRLLIALPYFDDVCARGISVRDRLAAVLVGSTHLFPISHDADMPSCFLVARCDPRRRYALATMLAEAGVESSWMYYPLHRLTYQETARFAETEAVWPSVLCLPARGQLSNDQVEMMSSVLANLR